MIIKNGAKILFQGDSVTDWGRDYNSDEQLGNSYVKKIDQFLKIFKDDNNIKVFNRGVSGNRVRDLNKRWQKDCLDLKPDIVTILVGINDCWRRYDNNDPTSVRDFESEYREILLQTKNIGAKIILMEPFVFPFPKDRLTWREDLDPKIQIVRKLSRDFNTILIPLDAIFASIIAENDPTEYAIDGVHPTDKGHSVIALEWLRAIKLI